MPRVNNQSRSWCFTDFKTDDDRIKYWKSLDYKRMVVGRETCPDTGKEHLQGYVTFTRAYRLTQLKRNYPKDIHWERALAQDAANYCRKDGDVVIDVDTRKQGTRTDIEQYGRDITKGMKLHDLVRKHPKAVMKFPRYYSNLRSAMVAPRDPSKPPTVIWLWGAPGSGKTRAVWDTYEVDQIWTCCDTTLKWFDGYEGQPVALLDDLNLVDTNWKLLLRVLDRYPLRVPIKGGFVQWSPEVIIITAVCEPSDGWMHVTEDRDQLYRRITHVYEINDDDLDLPDINGDNVVNVDWGGDDDAN
jgi:hypothetical protein